MLVGTCNLHRRNIHPPRARPRSGGDRTCAKSILCEICIPPHVVSHGIQALSLSLTMDFCQGSWMMLPSCGCSIHHQCCQSPHSCGSVSKIHVLSFPLQTWAGAQRVHLLACPCTSRAQWSNYHVLLFQYGTVDLFRTCLQCLCNLCCAHS